MEGFLFETIFYKNIFQLISINFQLLCRAKTRHLYNKPYPSYNNPIALYNKSENIYLFGYKRIIIYFWKILYPLCIF